MSSALERAARTLEQHGYRANGILEVLADANLLRSDTDQAVIDAAEEMAIVRRDLLGNDGSVDRLLAAVRDRG